GVPVDWPAYFAGSHARHTDLPTYAFQHTKYWLDVQDYWPESWAGIRVGQGDVSAAGLRAADHPLLSAIVTTAGSDGVVLTGRLSVNSQEWLADHVVFGSVVVAGAALVDLVIRAADEVGCDTVEELTFVAPLVLPEHGGIQVQVVVGGDVDGIRSVSVYSRAENTAPDMPWARHATGSLAVATDRGVPLLEWPPTGAKPVGLDGFYDAMAEAGLVYGPAFQGLRAAWRSGDEILAEVALPDGVAVDRFGLHPALLDAALHAIALSVGESGQTMVPFAWSGVRLHATGASALRVRVRPADRDSTVSVDLADAEGAPVASVAALSVMPLSSEQLSEAEPSANENLFEVRWPPVASVPGEPVVTGTWGELGDGVVPGVVVLPVEPGVDAGAVRAAVRAALGVVQQWVGEERFRESTLVVCTRGAVAVDGESVTDLAGAAVWGLVRSAQSENPGRFVLADVDGELDAAVLVGGDEPQVAVRGGALYAPRLVRARAVASSGGFGPGGTVLVTGATGTLGGLVARHLVAV
ncbi:polyketide synthase dehydratase domain-containing protein, partial [Kitasatospora sp. NPDC086801]|uniref:polyketide synthase dehydratase domain-containing protein n=1 Tax=Kitasatospora sp. NPDC086801 TaxID=3364066 RepID=UPI0037F365C8